MLEQAEIPFIHEVLNYLDHLPSVDEVLDKKPLLYGTSVIAIEDSILETGLILPRNYRDSISSKPTPGVLYFVDPSNPRAYETAEHYARVNAARDAMLKLLALPVDDPFTDKAIRELLLSTSFDPDKVDFIIASPTETELTALNNVEALFTEQDFSRETPKKGTLVKLDRKLLIAESLKKALTWKGVILAVDPKYGKITSFNNPTINEEEIIVDAPNGIPYGDIIGMSFMDEKDHARFEMLKD